MSISHCTTSISGARLLLPGEQPIALPIPLSAATPRLQRTFARWNSLRRGQSPGGLYRLKPAHWAAQAYDQAINFGRTSTIHAWPGKAPLDWSIATLGPKLGVYDRHSYIGEPLAAVPDRPGIMALAPGLLAAEQERRPQVHRIWGFFDGHSITYDRLVLPLPAPGGAMVHLFSITDERARARLDDLSRPGLPSYRTPQGRWLTLVR
jgi:hypothetical protein